MRQVALQELQRKLEGGLFIIPRELIYFVFEL